MGICPDELQQITSFDGAAIESALRNAAQRERNVKYILAGWIRERMI
jgi:hypothetical protein